jgi:N-acetylated-alpha-linked acidic dipeptidase
VYERKRAHELVNSTADTVRKELLKRKVERLDALGSGSDYSAFLQHAGITTLDLGFGGEDDGGEYHSIYDSYDMYVRFKDPDFAYGPALAGVAGHAVLRMADADVLPFDFNFLYETVNRYAKELEGLTKEMRTKTDLDNQLTEGGVYKLADDPTKNLVAPPVKADVPQLDFSALKIALDSLKHSAASMNAKWQQALQNGGDQHLLNEKLYRAEQQLLSPDGLPRRPWYRHTLYAPGFYTGYGVKTMPGIREAIEQRNWKEAQEQIAVDAKAITALATYLASN